MQLVRSIIRPNKVDVVKHALEGIGVSGMTIIEVRGHGKQKGRTAVYRGQEYEVTLLPKMLVECVVPDHLVESVIQAVIESARTGQIGDGRVFVTPVTASYRIRTGEREWSESFVPRIKHLGEVFASALARNAAERREQEAKAQAIHANYLEKSEKAKLAMFMEVAERAEAQIAEDA